MQLAWLRFILPICVSHAYYVRRDGVRCDELPDQYPVGSIGGEWSEALLIDAETICTELVACIGVMRYIGKVQAHCNEWCGRPQFCVGDNSIEGELHENDAWASYIKADWLLARGYLPPRDYGGRHWQSISGPSGPAAAPLDIAELSREVDCGGFSHPGWVGPRVLLVLDGADDMRLADEGTCAVVYRPFSLQAANWTVPGYAQGVLSEQTDEDVQIFTSSYSPASDVLKYYFDAIPEYPAGFTASEPNDKKHLLSVYFLSEESYCTSTDGRIMDINVTSDEFGPEHVYVEDGTHATREAALKRYYFTIFCGEFAKEPFPPLALIYSISYLTHVLAPEHIHWRGSRLFFHLPDAAQGFRNIHPIQYEAFARQMLENPKHEKLMEFKLTFTMLMSHLLWYRYREPARRRADWAACSICDSHARAERRAIEDANSTAAVAVLFAGMTRRSAHVLRQVVRSTWGLAISAQSGRWRAAQQWFVGLSEESSIEDLHYGDVVELPVPESYRTLNVKALAMLSWVHDHYPNLQWLVRHDDDVYLRAPPLMAQLTLRPPVRYIWGMLDHGSSPVRDPEHPHYNTYEQCPEQDHPMFGDIFPPYARGLLWAMSADLLGHVIADFKKELSAQPGRSIDERTANTVPHPDDPAVGWIIHALVLRGMSINMDDRDFNSFSLNPSCDSKFSNMHNRTWVVHHVKPETMRCMWDLDNAANASNISAANSALDASERRFPDLCLCSEEVVEEPDPEEDGLPFWYDRSRFNSAR